MDMTTQKVFHALIEEEFQIQGARGGKREQKAGQTPTGAADGDFAEMGPGHLPLLARKRAESQTGLLVSRPQRTQRSKPWCRCRAPFPWACRFRIGSAHCSGILPAKESIREDTSVTRGDEWRRRYARWRSRWSWRPSGLCW